MFCEIREVSLRKMGEEKLAVKTRTEQMFIIEFPSVLRITLSSSHRSKDKEWGENSGEWVGSYLLLDLHIVSHKNTRIEVNSFWRSRHQISILGDPMYSCKVGMERIGVCTKKKKKEKIIKFKKLKKVDIETLSSSNWV